MIGILAYGSLLANPGWELERRLAETILDLWTPFPVEYARKSSTRSGAPTLAPVPPGCGGPAKAAILVMKKFSHKDAIQNYLYRRELHTVGDRSKIYDHEAQLRKRNAIRIETLRVFHGLDMVYYAVFPANFVEILDSGQTAKEKAQLLAQAAIHSLTAETYPQKLDGIQYLMNNIVANIQTALTGLYSEAICTLADNAPDLAEARLRIAQQKGILP